MGKGIEEISKMNLADLDRPGENKKDPDREEIGMENETEGQNEGQETDAGQAGGGPNVFPGMEKEKMADPTGEHYTIDATISKEELKDFVRHQLFTQPAFLLIMVLGIALPIYTVIFQPKNLGMSLIFFVVLCIVYPIWQYKKVVDANVQNPVFKNVFHYMVDEQGFHLEAGLRAIDLSWKDFAKKRSLKTCHVLYTGKSTVYILPRKDMEGREDQIMAFIDRMMTSNSQKES